MIGLRAFQVFILFALSRAGFLKPHDASTRSDAQIKAEANRRASLRKEVFQLRSRLESAGERIRKLYGPGGKLSKSNSAPRAKSWYAKFHAKVHAGGPMSLQLRHLHEAKEGLKDLGPVLSSSGHHMLAQNRKEQEELLLGILVTRRKLPFEKQLEVLLTSDYNALPMLGMLEALRKAGDFRTPLANQVADYLDTHPEPSAAPGRAVAKSEKTLYPKKAAEAQSGMAGVAAGEVAAAISGKEDGGQSKPAATTRAAKVEAPATNDDLAQAQAIATTPTKKETEEASQAFPEEMAQAEEEAKQTVAQLEGDDEPAEETQERQLQQQSLLSISFKAGRQIDSTLTALQRHLSHLKSTVHQKLEAEKAQLDILLAAATRRKDSATIDARKFLFIAKTERRTFSKELAVDKLRIHAMQDAVDAVRSGNVEAVQAARNKIQRLEEEARQHRTNKFLVLLGIGQDSSSEDCPYCVAQCMEKCHTAGRSYVSCLTGCADDKTP